MDGGDMNTIIQLLNSIQITKEEAAIVLLVVVIGAFVLTMWDALRKRV